MAEEAARPRRISLDETIKIVRATLKRDFPGGKFHVRRVYYAGGWCAGIEVRYYAALSDAAIHASIGHIVGGQWDGMRDTTVERVSALDGEPVIFGNATLMVQAYSTDEAEAKGLLRR